MAIHKINHSPLVGFQGNELVYAANITPQHFSKATKDNFSVKSDRSYNISELLEHELIKLGHELHDTVNPMLAVAKLYIEMLKGDTKNEKFIKKNAISAILDAVSSVRKIADNLAIQEKEGLRLKEMLRRHVSRLSKTNIFQITTNYGTLMGLRRMTDKQKTCVYRIVQEQLNNIIKHSCASNVNLHFSVSKKDIYISLKDDGRGFNVSEKKNGVGLRSINRRAAECGGHAEVTSSPGNGCILKVWLPV